MLRRLLSALCIAVLVSGAFTWLVARRLIKPHQPSNLVRYATATRDIEAGEIVKNGDLAEADWPARSPVNGAVLQPGAAIGRALLSPVNKGQPLLEKQLSAVGGLGLSARVPNGMRAISLRSDEIVGVAGFLLPGTHIDVLVTYRAPATPDAVTATVLQDAEILATGQKTQPDPDGKPATTDVVTLLVTPANAQRLVLASSQGTLHFVLRNGADRQQNAPVPVDAATLGLRPSASVPLARAARPVEGKPRSSRGEARPEPARYSVLVVRGEKQSVESF